MPTQRNANGSVADVRKGSGTGDDLPDARCSTRATHTLPWLEDGGPVATRLRGRLLRGRVARDADIWSGVPRVRTGVDGGWSRRWGRGRNIPAACSRTKRAEPDHAKEELRLHSPIIGVSHGGSTRWHCPFVHTASPERGQLHAMLVLSQVESVALWEKVRLTADTLQ
jgi:hypothetical protein